MSTIARLIDRGRRLVGPLGAVLLPPVCCLCHAPGQPPDLDLCEVCASLLPSATAGSTPDFAAAHPIRALFLFKYAYPVDHFIRTLKFRGDRMYARVLGELLAREHCSREWTLPKCIIPMPLHVTRLRERGFNQALEVARFAGASLGVPIDSRSLVRKRTTREQSGLSLEARRKNVRDAFEVVKPLPAGRIALLDDVVTTGSTAMAALDALALAGARDLELWAIARVEKEEDD